MSRDKTVKLRSFHLIVMELKKEVILKEVRDKKD